MQRSSSQVTLHGFRAQPYILSHHTNMQVIIKCCLIPSRYSASQSCLVPSLFQLFLFLHFILLLSLRSMPPLRNNHFIYHTSTRRHTRLHLLVVYFTTAYVPMLFVREHWFDERTQNNCNKNTSIIQQRKVIKHEIFTCVMNIQVQRSIFSNFVGIMAKKGWSFLKNWTGKVLVPRLNSYLKSSRATTI